MRKFYLSFLALALLGQCAFGAVVYQQSNSIGTVNVNGNALSHLGDDVTLAGTERNLVSIDVGTRYYFDATHTAYTPILQLSLYDTTTPGTPGTGPGQLIATSISTGLPFVGVAGSQDQTITFLFNPVTDVVPNSFYLAVSQVNFDNNLALHYDGNPTIGSTATAEFGKFQANPNFSAFNIGGVTGLQTTINAVVPEPSTIALLGMGALGMVMAARRRKTS